MRGAKTVLRPNEKYLVDDRGRKTAVVLDIKAYNRLIAHLEDLEDALALDTAIREEKDFRPYEQIRAELKQSGQL